MADDDLCAPEFLSRAVEVLDSRPEVGLAYAPARFIDAAGQELSVFDPRGLLAAWPSNPVSRTRLMLDALFDQRELDLICTVGVFGLMRTKVLRRTKRMGSYSGADWTLMAEMALRAGIEQIPEPLIAIRRHEGAVSWQNFEPVSQSTYAATQLEFHDPLRKGWLQERISLWRRYWVMAAAIMSAPLAAADRVRLLAYYVQHCTARVTRRWLAPRVGRKGGAEAESAGARPQL